MRNRSQNDFYFYCGNGNFELSQNKVIIQQAGNVYEKEGLYANTLSH